MTKEQQGNNAPMIAGAAFVLLALLQLINAFRMMIYMGFFSGFIINILWVVTYGLLAFCLFTKRQDQLLLGAMLLMCVLGLYSLGGRTHFLHLFANLLKFLSMLSLLAVGVAALTEHLPQHKEKAQQLWFLPAAIFAVSFVLRFFFMFIGFRFSLFQEILFGIGVLFTGMWMATPANQPLAIPVMEDIASSDTIQMDETQSSGPAPGVPPRATMPPAGDGYCDMVKCILLLLFTFGIYYYVWIYRVTAYLNRVEEEPTRTPVNQLLLCIFVPFYSIYWTYKSAQRIDTLAYSWGIGSDLTTICLILAIFVGIVPPMIMQDKINAIAMAESGTAAPFTPVAPYAPATPPSSFNVAEEIKSYKELLDMGAITQEEFDQKKKQLLDL